MLFHISVVNLDFFSSEELFSSGLCSGVDSILCSFTPANINLSNELFVSFLVFVVYTFTDIE